MQHVEFLDKHHFENNYYRVKPPASLSHFIDFFWQTKFEQLWDEHPKGFSDALAPNIGYTYLINLGTPFVMQVADKKFKMKTDGFLPRHLSIECHHQPGNIIFGIKFKISPIVFEKKINFSEYKSAVFPLSYLLDKSIVQHLKNVAGFQQRVDLLNEYFFSITNKFNGSMAAVNIVTNILEECNSKNNFTLSVEEMAKKYKISIRTLQRYFENATSLSSKKTLQIFRVRKAVEALTQSPGDFDFRKYGYYDYSHFHKHLRKFLHKTVLKKLMAKYPVK